MILCVNLNAAVDKTVVVERFVPGAIHRPKQVKALAGGKGCNAARALHAFGEQPVVTGWVGGTAGQFIEQSLREEGIGCDFTQTGQESRACLSIMDESTKEITELYELGEPVSASCVEAFLTRFRAVVGDYEAVTLSGSIPPGAPVEIYAQLIRIANAAGVAAFLDSSGEALAVGIEAKPYLVKPNASEIAALVDFPLDGIADFARAAAEVAERNGTRVLLSLGKDGAVAADGERIWQVRLPEVAARSAVGSGDCMLGGLVFAWLQGKSFEEMLQSGAAAGTANTLKIGAGQFELADYQTLLGQVRVTEIVA